MLETITWLKDGKHRSVILNLLNSKPHLPTEIHEKTKIDRATISRVLHDLKDKELVDSISKKSRTVTYFITDPGIKILKEIKK